jgi:hypothetical protein
MKLTDILKQIIQEKKAKRDRCLRIADRKFNKPSAYKSGAVVRCRQGKIWKGLKENHKAYAKERYEADLIEGKVGNLYHSTNATAATNILKEGYINPANINLKQYIGTSNPPWWYSDEFGEPQPLYGDFIYAASNYKEGFFGVSNPEVTFIIDGDKVKNSGIDIYKAPESMEKGVCLIQGSVSLKFINKIIINGDLIDEEDKINLILIIKNKKIKYIVYDTSLKEDNQPSEGSYQQALKDIKPIIPVLSHNLIHQQSLEHNEENMVKLNQKIFDLVKKGDGTILDRLWDLAGNSLLKNAINIITFYHKSNLNESKQVGPLYHFTDFFSLKKILTSNTMIGSYGNQDIKGRYISTTRDKNFYKSDPNLGVENLQVALIFDGNKLSNKYKIKPYAYEPYRDLDRSGAEAEELIILPGRDLPNIKSYLSGVILLKPNKAIESFLKKENIPYNVDLSEAKKETLRTWFKRKGAPGKTGGWVDCNSPIRKDGKITGYKPCGRQKGEERAKYPSCRPTAARCKDKGKGTKWGKTK